MISLIIPCYNEEAVLSRYHEIFFPHFAGMDIEYLFVDDGSMDYTGWWIRHGLRQRCITHFTNLGVGEALKTGIALARGNPIVTIDADLSYDAPTLVRLIERFQEGDADCVSASPYVDRDLVEGVRWHRWAMSMGANQLYRRIAPNGITCFSSIARVYRAEVIRGMDLKSSGFDINAEIMIRLLKSGAKVIEVPAVLHQRKYGESKVRLLREVTNTLRLLVKN